jgi:hypothetical protein
MFEVILPLYVAFLGLSLFVFMQSHALSAQIAKVAGQIEEKMGEPIEVPPSFMEELKDGLEDLVHDTISTMQPPNAADHVMGAIAQLIQMKAMQKFGMVPQIDEEARSKIDPDLGKS